MSEPQKEDIKIYRGDDFILSLEFGYIDEATGEFTAHNLTGQPIIAQIRKTTATNSQLSAAFTINRTDEAVGKIIFKLAGEDTQGLSGGDYKYDIQIYKTTKVYGTATIIEDVSR
ncbi:hypothetical protein [Zoogloea sp.]|uniref:hypothetical protein n=1 Tax=Zoogloea sp. TaxID=49181 RepID=UPI001416A8CC|nr:MAG: hypothetical protein F9K15_02455 [Zoogloea sp.]